MSLYEGTEADAVTCGMDMIFAKVVKSSRNSDEDATTACVVFAKRALMDRYKDREVVASLIERTAKARHCGSDTAALYLAVEWMSKILGYSIFPKEALGTVDLEDVEQSGRHPNDRGGR